MRNTRIGRRRREEVKVEDEEEKGEDEEWEEEEDEGEERPGVELEHTLEVLGGATPRLRRAFTYLGVRKMFEDRGLDTYRG